MSEVPKGRPDDCGYPVTKEEEEADYYLGMLENSWVSYDEEDEIDDQCQAEDENEGMDLDSPFEYSRSDQAGPAFYEDDMPLENECSWLVELRDEDEAGVHLEGCADPFAEE